MNQAVLVRRLKTAARLREDLDHAVDRQPMAGFPDQLLERLTRKQRHHEERLALPRIVEFPHVEDLDDVRVADRLEGGALLVEQLEAQGGRRTRAVS